MSSLMQPSFLELARLEPGPVGPVNAIAFSRDGQFLASGGDDERVRIWRISTSTCVQVLQATYESPQEQYGWAQITSLLWTIRNTGNQLLCIGTGRGLVIICEKQGGASFSANASRVFPFNDSVESAAYDDLNDLLVFGSQSGRIKLCQYDDKNTALQSKWERARDTPTIPSSVRFCGEENAYILVSWLDIGQVSALDGSGVWLEHLKGAIGHADLSQDETILLVHNLNTGNFDVYTYPETKFIRTLLVPSSKHVTKQCKLLRQPNGRMAVCGSNDGTVHLFDLQSGILLQKLLHGRGAIQTVAACQTRDMLLVASGSDSECGRVVVWSKPLTMVSPRITMRPGTRDATSSEIYVVVFLLFIILTSIWKDYVAEIYNMIIPSFQHMVNEYIR